MLQERNLDYRKKETKKRTIELFCCVAFLLVMLSIIVVVVIFAIKDEKQKLLCLYFTVPVLALVCAGFLIGAIYMLHIYILIKKADATLTEEVTVNCKKVKFISYPINRFSWIVMGVILCDDCGCKYISFFSRDYDTSEKKELKTKLTREMILEKYSNSKVVSGVEKYL